MDLRVQCLCVDTTDPARLAGSWQEALGWRRTHADDDEVVLADPDGDELCMLSPLALEETPG